MVKDMPSDPTPSTQISLDVMQFAELGSKLALNQFEVSAQDQSCFLKLHDDELVTSSTALRPSLLPPPPATSRLDEVRQLQNRRKRARAWKTSEEVESQRMAHIAVERNRRRQMNEHLRVLRSLMPGSYVKRGDQASIVGGAIELVRELEQLLQRLESQKRRRLFGGGKAPKSVMDGPPLPLQQRHQVNLLDLDHSSRLREEIAENRSCLADVEVRLLGFDAMIKILSRRRPRQLIRTIAALEDLQLAILHTSIATIEPTVLYSFNVKIASESLCTAEDIANSVQRILCFIDANTSSQA
ncbi:transcription factor FAMA-like [Musa acuminata AAA Group]|uniref:transcription factor FAMA-like n=1 Tax=Musa acuminata AAA Group TaxID=214697 RepID=UPI0031DBF663